MEGIFTISLDFELHWGVFDKKDRDLQKACYVNTIDIIPKLLRLFTKYEIHVTWATVGSLFAKDANEWAELKPDTQPSFSNEMYSAYIYAKKNGLADQYSWAHFAPETIREILQFAGQELGTHTFAHYYCLEPEQNPKAFEADLAAVEKAASKFNKDLVSLVFPRNQFEPQFLDICYRKGIKVVRSNPEDWFWKPIPDSRSGMLRKVLRTGDAYLPLGKRTSYPLQSIRINPNEPIQLPASRFLRPWQPKLQLANTMHVRRVMNEMAVAAKKKECYHLWWHPENFGYYPEQNLNQLEILLSHFQKMKTRFGMKSWNMGEYTSMLN
ncbi:MAG: polysaccharide deacetylase family protein [Chitinophagaceae bacterium]|nr:polysaccharide deacetylase family protein [Chitinophagaceae bacterium]